jgi:UDP-N-acetylmuramoyl-L-alanyl-D-glutamate--2,6-diaminopimelate ligase
VSGQPAIRLSELAAGFPISPGGLDPEISGISEDSRRITRGMLFVAIPGSSLDGHAYIADAVSRGAAAVVAERTGAIPPGIPVVRVPSSRAALALLASRFYRTSSNSLQLIGFTGTFGKTSTSEILRALLDAGGARTGVIGSLGARFANYRDLDNGLTTPAPVELHRALKRLEQVGASTAILEVTSHALRLGRVDGLRFSGGLIAAIMPGEHTDFHRSYDDYVEAKRLFLAHLEPDALLAYDADNVAARRMIADWDSQATRRASRTAGFTTEGRDADLEIYDVVMGRSGTSFKVAGPVAGGRRGEALHSALLGRGHLRNVSLALTYALSGGLSIDSARRVLAGLTPLRRRMETYVVAGRSVLDDTAAHPDSLRETLDVASLLPHSTMAVVYAIRGNRGPDINRRNATALADLAAVHGVDPLIVTASVDATDPADAATPAEIDAARQALVTRGRRFVWQDNLDDALREAMERTRAGDLLVLVGAQGMNEGREVLRSLDLKR